MACNGVAKVSAANLIPLMEYYKNFLLYLDLWLQEAFQPLLVLSKLKKALLLDYYYLGF